MSHLPEPYKRFQQKYPDGFPNMMAALTWMDDVLDEKA